MKLTAVLVLLIVGCGNNEFVPPPPPDPVADAYASLQSGAKEGSLSFMVLSYAALPKADRAKKSAPQAAPAMIASWDKISEGARKMAKTEGVNRARGKVDELGLADTTTMLDELSAVAPPLAAKWTPLKMELTQVEQSAYTAEHDDTRPLITVWTKGASGDDALAGLIVTTCVQPALEKKFPDLKFVPEYHKVTGPSIELRVVLEHQKYRSTTTGETTSLSAGGSLELEGHELTGVIAKVFSTKIVANASVDNPSEISSDLGVTPTVEVTRAGMDAIDSTQKQLCAGVEQSLAAR